MQQANTRNTIVAAIPAAIATNTSLLLGIWCRGGTDFSVGTELAALKAAVDAHGEKLAKLVVGIAVGHEELASNSEAGSKNGAVGGLQPGDVVRFIMQTRAAIQNTALARVPVGHIDTWSAWANASNQAVVAASDFLGMNFDLYSQRCAPNTISTAKILFDSARLMTKVAAIGRPVWITEVGFPVSGSRSNGAVPSPLNAKYFWDVVGCPLLGTTNVWWKTLRDTGQGPPNNPSYGVVARDSTAPLFDMSCAPGSTYTKRSHSFKEKRKFQQEGGGQKKGDANINKNKAAKED